MIILFILDVLIYSVTSINIPLILFLFPFKKNILNIIIISIVLLLIDLHYWAFIITLITIYLINLVLKKEMRFNVYTYYILLVIDYLLYYLFVGIIKI